MSLNSNNSDYYSKWIISTEIVKELTWHHNTFKHLDIKIYPAREEKSIKKKKNVIKTKMPLKGNHIIYTQLNLFKELCLRSYPISGW